MKKDKLLVRDIVEDGEGRLYLGERVAEDLSRELVTLLNEFLSDFRLSSYLEDQYNLKASLFGSIKNQAGVRYNHDKKLKINDIDIQLFDLNSNEPMSDEVLSKVRNDAKLKNIFRLFMRSLQNNDSKIGKFLYDNDITVNTYDLEIFGQVSENGVHGTVVFFEDFS